MIFSLNCTAQEKENNEGQNTLVDKYFIDTGDGYWMSYDSGMVLVEEREDFKSIINELERIITQLEAELENKDDKITIYQEVLQIEREQHGIITASKDKVVLEMENELRLKDDKIDLLEENNKLKDEQIANWKEIYRNKDSDLSVKLKWSAGGFTVGAILGLLGAVVN